MFEFSFKLSAYESADDIRQGGDDFGLAGRDTTQCRCALRPSVARGVAGSGGNELSTGGREARGFPRHDRELGDSLREVRLRRPERSRGARATIPIGTGRDEASGECFEEEPGRFWVSGPILGRPPAVEFPRKTIWHRPASPTVPAIVSATRISPSQTPPGNCSRRSDRAGHSKKNSSASQQDVRSTCGPWTRSISSSTVAAVGCGCLQKSEIRSAATLRPASLSVTSVQFVFAMDAWSPPNRKAALMPKPAGHSCVNCVGRAVVPADALLSSSTTLNTTTPPFTLNGGANKSRTSSCSFFPLIVPSSTQLNGSGNSCADFGCTTDTFPHSMNSPKSSMLSSLPGTVQARSCAVCALSNNMYNYL